MVKVTEKAPSPTLQPYIKCFAFREVDTFYTDLLLPMHAVYEMYLTFYLDDQPPLAKNFVGADATNFVFGLQSLSQGIVCFNGRFRLFMILFKPNGFYNTFGIPPETFTNLAVTANEVFPSSITTLKQQLQEAKTMDQMVAHAERFLLSHLLKTKADDPYNCIQSASNVLLRCSGNINIERLASDASMSLKTFERKFIAQVGVSPKLFARIVRFHAALSLKIKYDHLSWLSIAHQCGYFDQMHFIKDFKQFAGAPPRLFFNDTPPPKENLLSDVE